jgi:enamine deaminase RidA (YjgF/YER057c/UK114 family)
MSRRSGYRFAEKDMRQCVMGLGAAPSLVRRLPCVGDIAAQTRQVCENLKAAVEEAGGTMDDICRVDVYVRNMEHFDAIHKVRREYFKAPASTMVEVSKMTSPEYLIEINAIAVLPHA